MMTWKWMIPAAVLAVATACEEPEGTPLGVTLDDEQVVVGQIQTEILTLESAMGPLDIPLDDVGVVLPVEGTSLADSGGHVTV